VLVLGTQETARATVDVATAAERLGIHPHSLYAAIKRGECPLPVIRVGRRFLIPVAALDRLLEDGVLT
jgi:excisionase family DNA binding protein